MEILTINYGGITYAGYSPDDLLNAGVPQSFIQQQRDSIHWNEIREKRSRLLLETDGMYFRHSRELRSGKVPDDVQNPTTLSSNQLAELDIYTQALADIPQTYSNPDDVIWPTKPTL